MKCPKCGYTSFDYLTNCKKCHSDLTAARKKLNSAGILLPGIAVPPPVTATPEKNVSRIPDGELEALHPPARQTAASLRVREAGEEEKIGLGEEIPLHSLFGDFPSSSGEEERKIRGREEIVAVREERDPLAVSPECLVPGEAALLENSFQGWISAEKGVVEQASHRSDLQEAAATFRGRGGYPSDPAPAGSRAPTTPLEDPAEDLAPLRFSLDDFDSFAAGGDRFAPSPEVLPELTGEFASPEERATSTPLRVVSEDLPEDASESGEEGPDPAAAGSGLVFFPARRARAAASLLDLLFLAAVFSLFILAGEIALRPAGAAALRPLAVSLLEQSIPYFLVLFCLGFGYFTLFHFLLGQTLGKMLLRLRVETEAGAPLSFSRAFLRSTGGLLALLTAGVGFLPLLRRGGRGLNDRLAGTRVVLAVIPTADAEPEAAEG